MSCGGDAKGWDDKTIIMAAEPEKMPVERFFLFLQKSNRIIDDSIPPDNTWLG